MYRPPPKPFNRTRTGLLMVTIGSIIAVLTGLFLYVMLTRLDMGSLPYPYDSLSGFMDSSMVPLALMTIIGGSISFIGGLVARGNPRNGGIIAIIGSIAGGVNVITLIGGIFLLRGNEPARPQSSQWNVTPVEEARWKGPGLKRCPACSAQMPLEARFCPSCGEPFGG